MPQEFNKVCIVFGQAVKDAKGNTVQDICADFVQSNQGVVEYGDSSRTQSVTSTSTEVELNI